MWRVTETDGFWEMRNDEESGYLPLGWDAADVAQLRDAITAALEAHA